MTRRRHHARNSHLTQWEQQYQCAPARRQIVASAASMPCDTADTPHSAGSVTTLLLAGVLVCSSTGISNAQSLPMRTLPVPMANFATSGIASIATSGANMTVNQLSERAILNWNSFNISSDSAVRFNQPGSTSVALNRIFDANPSIIQGQLSANGQIYLINRNGILFDKGSQINVNTLIASSLDINDQLFNNGILSGALGNPVFQQKPGDPAGAVIVEAGARIQTDSAGRVLLMAPSVINRGEIRTPDGQTLLAAGNKIYLRSSSDVNLRGFLVEVDTGLLAPDPAKAAVNEGTIRADRGNITMVGLAVRQSGELTASTSTGANGSIVLNARDGGTTGVTVSSAGGEDNWVLKRAGTVDLTAGSLTQVVIDSSDKTGIDSNVTFNPSKVDVMGRRIVIEGSIVAPSGSVTLKALADPSTPSRDASLIATPNDSRIFLAGGSNIDVSGTAGTVLPMSSNLLTVELRGDELKDFPLQRDGLLRGQKVVIDVNKGTTVADVSKQIAGAPRGIGEISSTGGTVKMESEGDIVMQRQATINVSGGQVAYESGPLYTTKLVSQGRVYDISTASPDRDYDAILNGADYSIQVKKWNVTQTFDVGRSLQRDTPGYVKGGSAGSVSFKAHGLALDGLFFGGVIAGPNQREAGKLPVAGLLELTDYDKVGNATLQARNHDVVLQQGATTAAPAMVGDALPIDQPLMLSTGFITDGGFGRVNIARNGSIEVPQGVDLNMPAGGSVALKGYSLDVGANISAPGGSIDLQTVRDITKSAQQQGVLAISPNSTLSTRGLWVNDLPAVAGPFATGPTLINAGTISINAVADLRLGAVAGDHVSPTVLDVTGGGSISASGSFKAGNGGNLTIGGDGTMQLGAVIRGMAPGAGGKLTLRAPDVTIQNGVSSPSVYGPTLAAGDIAQAGTSLTLPSWMFNSLGFTTYEVRTATQNISLASSSLTVAPYTDLNPQAPYLVTTQDARLRPTGSDIYEFSRVEARPDLRRAANLTLDHSAGAGTSLLTVGQGARIHTDSGAKVTLGTNASMVIDGHIEAPAGTIALNLREVVGQPQSPAQSIWLGAQSVLSTAGVVKLTPDPLGRQIGTVLDGGSVAIVANRGTVVTEAGSRIDVSGAQADLDLPTANGARERQSVTSNAGAISITAAEGMLLDGELHGRPGGAGAAGGSLSLTLTTRNRADDGTPAGQVSSFPPGDRVISLRAGDASAVPAALKPGMPIQNEIANDLTGLALFNTNKLAAGGFAEFTARSDQEIRFADNMTLATGRSVILDAPKVNVLNHIVTVSAPYVALGSSETNVRFQQIAPTATPGTGALGVNANLIELVGNTAIDGANAVSLSAVGDIRTRGVLNTANQLTGAFTAGGTLELKAAQVYPTTFSQFAINSTGDMLVSPSGAEGNLPLSAGGVLILEAPNITVDGTLRAPFGSLELTATDTLALTPRSLVSVSGTGMLTPFGATQNGLEWVYNPVNGVNLLLDRPAEKTVRLKGANVNLLPGATVDLSGGGDLYAYEFVPGPGGSKDALANVVDGKANTMFAVMPGLNSASAAYAPYDQQYYLDSTLKPGDSVYLSGGGGLAAGTYALLPVRYALLPGAFLIKPATGVSSIIPGRNTAQLDGTPVVAGYRTAAGTGTVDNRWTAYAIQPGSAGRTLAEYRDASANTFFAASAQAAGIQTPPLPADAGRLVLDVTQSLAFAGARLQTGHAPGTRGAEVDISATRLAITSPDSVNTGGLGGYVQVSASDLSALNAESLLLGGTRTPTAEGMEVRVNSQDVVIANSAVNPLRAPEVIIAGNDTVTVRSGAVVEGVGARVGSNIATGYQYDPAKPVTDTAQIARRDINRDGKVDAADNIDGRGALLRVSGGDQVQVARANVIDRTRGVLEVQADARVEGDRSLILDATRDTLVRSGARIGAGTLSRDTNGDGVIDANDNRVGGSASLSAGLISAGDTASANGGLGVDRGLLLSNTLLDQLRGLNTLSLRSYSTIDFYGATQIGSIDTATGKPFLTNLELNSAGIGGYSNAGTVSSIFASSVLLTNTVDAGFSATPNGTGLLNINADRVTFGAGNKAISGYGNVAITAGTEIRTEGAGSTKVGGALALDAPRITAGVASRQTLSAERDNGTAGIEYFPLFISATGALPATAAAADSVAAQLTITGASVQHGGVIDLPGGVVTLSAKGTAGTGGDVHLTSGSSVSARGVTRTLAGVPVNAPAGAVNMLSEQGNVLIDAGARVDVSSGNSDAGKIAVSAAQGVAAINGELAGSAPADSRGGVFTLDARTLNGDITQTTNDFSALNTRLNSGGFTAERSIRARAGDLTVAASDTVTARTVKLVADDGKVDVNGTIDARGPNGGSILLAARGDVSVNPGGVLLANATTEDGSGGNVTASSTSGQIVFAAGSQVDVNKFAYAASNINVVATGHTVPGGTASAYTADMAVAPGAYSTGMEIVFQASDNSLGASTLSVNGLPPKTIRRFDGTNTAADDIRAGEIVKLTYDGTYFRLPPGDKGTVLLRASRTPAGNDVAVSALGVINGAREIVAEGVKVYNASTISDGADSVTNLSTAATGIANTEATNFVLDTNFNSNGVRRRLSTSVAESFRVRPGVEVRSDGDLTISGEAWNFFNPENSLSWRYNGEPGVLTVRAAGNIAIDTSISDGFSTANTTGVLQNTLSWSYRFTSGADLSSASTAAVLPLSGSGALAADKGDLTVAAGALVRTGTGSIDMVGGRDFVLGKSASGPNRPSAAVYTAGKSSERFPVIGSEGFPIPTNTTTNPFARASYPVGGGDLNISAQQDILGAISPQLMSEWLVRRGAVDAATGNITSGRNTGWGVDFAKFGQNTGALGGGDVTVSAGRDIHNLSAMLPTTGRLLGAAGTQPDANKLVVTGGGDLSVAAGGDIRSGVYYIGRGEGTIRAGGSIIAGRTVGDTNTSSADALLPVHTLLAVGDGRFDVRAAGEINLESVVNPTVVVQEATAVSTPSNRSYFYTYSPNAAVKLDALSGDVTLHHNLAALKASSAPPLKFAEGTSNSGDADALVVYPGKLDVYAALGNIKIGGPFTMYPSARGNLQLIAGNNVNFDYNGASTVNLSDADSALLVNPLRPSGVYGGDPNAVNTFTRLSYSGLASVNRALTPVHQQDENNPVRIVAATGSITGGELYLSKPAELYAGQDVQNVTFNGQNLRAGDVTSIVAGRDISFGTPRDAAGLQVKNDKGLILGGPGRFEIEAGRNVDLGNSVGVVTRANLINPALPPSGADITIGAGISSTPGYGAFVTKYFTTSEQTAVAQFARIQTGDASLSDSAAIAAFDTLPRTTQLAAPFMSDLRSRFYNELKMAGREAGQPGGNYQRGFSAIATLFPDTVYRGDLSLLFSQIKTESGGRIDVLVPGGRVNAGQTTPPAQSGSAKRADELGLLVLENGAVHAFSKGDFAVNESRVFTLRGGDILIWSSDGDIDAGRGAKTAVSAPAPILVTDSNGNTSYKFQSVSGSGIRSILTRSDIVPGSVDLIAPRGTVNAGDAGIGSAGDINIAALRVVGADNIQVGGKSSGVPLGDGGGAGRGLSGLSNAGSDATRSVEQSTRNLGGAPAETFRPGMISVEVLGIGN